jgi:hypothetical protein
MRLNARLRKLEQQTRPQDDEQRHEYLEEDWLEVFEDLAREGTLDREPDFPVALAALRAELARAQADPAFHLPCATPGQAVDRSALHQHRLRQQARFGQLDAALIWVWEMLQRHTHGIPPVSEAEFQELQAWFEANADRLYQAALPSYLLHLPEGRTTSVANLRYNVGKGPRQFGSGELARDLRWLRDNMG